MSNFSKCCGGSVGVFLLSIFGERRYFYFHGKGAMIVCRNTLAVKEVDRNWE